MSLALVRARAYHCVATRTTEPRFDCANVLRRTHCLVRRSSISSEHDLERSFVSHSNSKGDGETTARRRDATHDARRDTTHDARRDTTHDAADDYWCSRRPASGGITSHARTQLRLASPRPLARTHERNEYDFPVGLTPQPPIYIYIYMYNYSYTYRKIDR